MEAWFDPNRYAWIPGTAFGCIAVALGALAAWLVPKGRAKKFIVRSWSALCLVALIFLVAGITAFGVRQPWGVWYGLLLPGIVGTAVMGGNLMVILRKYHEAEKRRTMNGSV
jgi:uncharacterized membrane protein